MSSFFAENWDNIMLILNTIGLIVVGKAKKK